MSLRGFSTENDFRTTVIRRLTQWGGMGAVLLGAVIAASWLAHWSALIQPLFHRPSMKWNTALCFIACGLATLGLTTERRRLTERLGAVVTALALATLLEYLTGGNFGIDELFIRDYVTAPTMFPGRMSPLTAFSFLCLSTSLVLAARGRREDLIVSSSGLCIALSIAAIALCGYAAGIEPAYGWGAYTRMAVHTAVALAVLCTVLLLWIHDVAEAANVNVTRWLLLTASGTMMIMVVCVSVTTLEHLRTSLSWRKHSYEVLISSQSLLADLVDSQRGMRGYVLTGQPASLEIYRSGVANLPSSLHHLAALTVDNPTQHARAVGLSADVASVIAYSDQLVTLRATQDISAAIALESTGAGSLIVDRLRADLDAFTVEEHRLLDVRDVEAENSFRNTGNLLILGTVVATLLLGLAHLAANQELSHRRRAEGKVRQFEERDRLIVEELVDHVIYQLGPYGEVLTWNKGAQRMMQYTSEEILEENFSRFFTPEARDRDEPQHALQAAASTGRYFCEGWCVRKDGSQFWAEMVLHALRDDLGSVVGFAKVTHDATQRLEVDRVKREFISTVSHELRTPLTSIRGSLGLVSSGVLGELPEKVTGMIRIAYQNSERLVRIINDILDIEKLESGKMELRIASVRLRSLLQQAIADSEGYGARYQVRFLLASSTSEGAADDIEVRADGDRLMQVLTNLLSNAAKFSPAGGEVLVRYRITAERARVEVEDRGIGIAKEFHGRIFQKFAQADSSAARRFDGTGLGLSIARQLMEAMGGRIGFNSVVGQGTTFHFELPLATQALASVPTPNGPAAPPARTQAQKSHQPRNIPRILHVEDDADLSRVIEAALAGQAEVIMAPTLRSAEESLRNGGFSLVVLDAVLPDGNGLELLDRFPDLTQQTVPIVILSVSEVSQSIRQRVAAVLIKSRHSEAEIAATILSLTQARAA